MNFETEVGLLGFGRFGSMVYEYLAERGPVRVYDHDSERTRQIAERASLKEVLSFRTVILAVPISAIAAAAHQMAPHLGSGQLVIDTCSVKEIPLGQLQEALDPEVEILGTHPLFGPDSGKDGIGGLKMVVCPVRIEPRRYARICEFLSSLGVVLIEATPEEHDREIARTQAIFHLIAQTMKELGWGTRLISTPGPESFYRLVRSVQRDTAQLFSDLETQNPYAAEYRRRFIQRLVKLDRELGRSRT